MSVSPSQLNPTGYVHHACCIIISCHTYLGGGHKWMYNCLSVYPAWYSPFLLSYIVFIVLVAETIAHYFPKLVELHNYPPATGTKLKIENWSVLNRYLMVYDCVMHVYIRRYPNMLCSMFTIMPYFLKYGSSKPQLLCQWSWRLDLVNL